MIRSDGRKLDEIRQISFELGTFPYAEGSSTIIMGNTKVLCAASVEEKVPKFLRGKGSGWITAEYSMLPRSTHTRKNRDIDGRSREIMRFIGRSFRSIVDLRALGERTIVLDCDVLQADGGTRTAAINGGFLALYQAIFELQRLSRLEGNPISHQVGALSAGIVDEEILIDLSYEEDVKAQVDLNIVGTEKNYLVEIQGTAEKTPFSQEVLDEMIKKTFLEMKKIFAAQKACIKDKLGLNLQF